MRVGEHLQIFEAKEPALKIAFVGNSITYHGPREEVGWFHHWGMAASCEEKDYVHQAVALLRERFGGVSYAIVQSANWERTFREGDGWQARYEKLKVFAPDVVCIRLGENILREELTKPDLKEYLRGMVHFFAEGCRQVIITDCFWRREALDNLWKELCEEEGYTFCKISDIYEDESMMALGQFEYKAVALHPSDKGMRAIAERIVDVVE